MGQFKVEMESRVVWIVDCEASDEKDAVQQAVYEIEAGHVNWDRMVQLGLRKVEEVKDAESNQ